MALLKKAKLKFTLAQLIDPLNYRDVKDNARILARQPIDDRETTPSDGAQQSLRGRNGLLHERVGTNLQLPRDHSAQ